MSLHRWSDALGPLVVSLNVVGVGAGIAVVLPSGFVVVGSSLDYHLTDVALPFGGHLGALQVWFVVIVPPLQLGQFGLRHPQQFRLHFLGL